MSRTGMCFCASGCARSSMADPGAFSRDCSCWCHDNDPLDGRVCPSCGVALRRMELDGPCSSHERRERGGMNDRRHPLPWSIRNGTVRLRSDSHDETDGRPYRLSIGRHDSMSAALSEEDLRMLRGVIDDLLAAPFRVLAPNPGAEPEQWQTDKIRDRLDRYHIRYPHMEVAVLDVDSLDSVPVCWAVDVHVPVLIYQDVASMVADGGSRMLIVAGQGALDLARAAHERGLDVDLIRPAARTEIAA